VITTDGGISVLGRVYAVDLVSRGTLHRTDTFTSHLPCRHGSVVSVTVMRSSHIVRTSSVVVKPRMLHDLRKLSYVMSLSPFTALCLFFSDRMHIWPVKRVPTSRTGGGSKTMENQ